MDSQHGGGGIKKRIAKKIINAEGRELLKRFWDFNNKKIGDLICTYDGLNSKVITVDPIYYRTKRGIVLVDLEFTTDKTSCSMFHCGVSLPITYDQAEAYRLQTIEMWKNNTSWDFADRYSRIKVHEDGTYTLKENKDV